EPAGIRALTTSPSFGELRSLHLIGCQAGDRECEALARSSTLPMLTDLSLAGSRLHPGSITPAGLEILAHSPKLSRLKYLNLDESEIGDAGVEALASATELRQLCWLSLGENAIGARGVRALSRSPFWPNLQWLFLPGNALGD